MERGNFEVPPVKGAARLKVGILLPAEGCVAWVEHLVREIAAASFSEVAFIGVAERPDGGRRPMTGLLWRLYTAIDRVWARSSPDAFAAADLSAATPERIERFDPGRPLPSCAGLDVLLLLGDTAELRGQVPRPRYGLWWFDGGSGSRGAGGGLGGRRHPDDSVGGAAGRQRTAGLPLLVPHQRQVGLEEPPAPLLESRPPACPQAQGSP